MRLQSLETEERKLAEELLGAQGLPGLEFTLLAANWAGNCEMAACNTSICCFFYPYKNVQLLGELQTAADGLSIAVKAHQAKLLPQPWSDHSHDWKGKEQLVNSSTQPGKLGTASTAVSYHRHIGLETAPGRSSSQLQGAGAQSSCLGVMHGMMGRV